MGRIEQALAKARAMQEKSLGGSKSRAPAQKRRFLVSPDDSPDNGVRVASLCKHKLNAPVDVLRENRIVAGLPDHKADAVDDYKMLRTKVLRRLSSNKWRSIAITSTKQGEGKTLTALNLGISISRDRNYDVILVDADLRSPSIHQYLGIRPKKGLSDYLEGKASLKDILVSPGIEGFAVIPNLQAIENSSEALLSKRMDELLAELEELSPSVVLIFDLPPLTIDDALAFAPQVDTLMLVFKAGETSREAAVTARELIADLPVIGCVVNSDKSSEGGAYY